MRRKITSMFEDWALRQDKKPLVLFGARQTGKTTSVLDFASSRYQSVVHIDFVKQPAFKAAFERSLDPANIITMLEAMMRKDIDPESTLLFLDEIQECDQALSSLKYFQTDMPKLDVIAAGSLLGVHVARHGSFPVGYVDMLTMHPMDFEEYCWARGEERAFELVRTSYKTATSCPLHERMIELYHDYLLVGGMPEVVRAHSEGKGFERVRRLQTEISTAYVADMAKYATAADAAKIVATWESIPSQLAKESGSTKFMWRYVASGAKAERYATALDWLVAAGVVDKCTQVTDGRPPLKSFENPAAFKVYVADTGLLTRAYDARPTDFTGKDCQTARFRGGVAENYVMQQLTAAGIKPYYWGMQSTHEVEFVIKQGDSVVPVEVKSGRRVRSTSAQRFAEKYDCPYIIRVSEKDFGKTDSVISVPLYAACLLSERDDFSVPVVAGLEGVK